MSSDPGIIGRVVKGDTVISSEGLLYMKAVGCKANERSQRGRPRETQANVVVKMG